MTRGMISLFLVRLLDGGMVVLIFAVTLLVAQGSYRAERAPSLIAADLSRCMRAACTSPVLMSAAPKPMRQLDRS